MVESLASHGNFVYDVAWAPNMGRSYELIATASKDFHVRIFKISNMSQTMPSNTTSLFRAGASETKALQSETFTGVPSVTLVADFTDHQAEVWRVSWNVTGSILSSSGDDGRVRLWKADAFNSWKPLTIVNE